MFSPADRERVKANWPLIAVRLKQHHVTDRDIVLYVIATIDAETLRKFSTSPKLPSSHSKKVDKPGYAGIQDSGTARAFCAYDSSMSFPGGKLRVNKDRGNTYDRGKDDALMRARHGDPPIPDVDHGFIQITGRNQETPRGWRLRGGAAVGQQAGAALGPD